VFGGEVRFGDFNKGIGVGVNKQSCTECKGEKAMINSRKSRVLFGAMVVFLAVVISGIVCWPQTAEAQTTPKIYKWRMQTIDPPSLVGPRITQKGFVERIKQMSNGRLDITLYTAGQLVSSLEILGALQRGTVDIAYTAGNYYTGTIPETDLEPGSLPPQVIRSVNDARQIWWNMGVDDIIREAYAEHGVHFLGNALIDIPVVFWSKRPIRTVADLKGKKFRSFSYVAKTFQKLGATPVHIPHEETYLALQQGIIDGSMTYGNYYRDLRHYEVAPYLTVTPLLNMSSMVILASTKSWNDLPDDLKAIVNEAFRVFSVDHSHANWWGYEDMIQNLKSMNSTPITWSPEEVKKLRDAGATFMADIAGKSARNAKGIKIIEDYMKKVQW
jgi:TRAP-type C4-dicarboxylate transport system substrate-binding protein